MHDLQHMLNMNPQAHGKRVYKRVYAYTHV